MWTICVCWPVWFWNGPDCRAAPSRMDVAGESARTCMTARPRVPGYARPVRPWSERETPKAASRPRADRAPERVARRAPRRAGALRLPARRAVRAGLGARPELPAGRLLRRLPRRRRQLGAADRAEPDPPGRLARRATRSGSSVSNRVDDRRACLRSRSSITASVLLVTDYVFDRDEPRSRHRRARGVVRRQSGAGCRSGLRGR